MSDDVSVTLVTALNGKRHDLRELLERLAPYVEMRVDWDEHAGERWARILIDDDVIAIVHAHLPLAFLLTSYLEPLKNLLDVEDLNVVAVDQFDIPILQADSEVLDALAEGPVGPALDCNAFSVDELWFVSV